MAQACENSLPMVHSFTKQFHRGDELCLVGVVFLFFTGTCWFAYFCPKLFLSSQIFVTQSDCLLAVVVASLRSDLAQFGVETALLQRTAHLAPPASPPSPRAGRTQLNRHAARCATVRDGHLQDWVVRDRLLCSTPPEKYISNAGKQCKKTMLCSPKFPHFPFHFCSH